MSKMKQLFKNISPLNNRTEMPVILYVIKVIIIFWFVKFGLEFVINRKGGMKDGVQ